MIKSALMLIAAGVAMKMDAQETLPPLKDGKTPQTFEEMWDGFDPKREALEIEILKEWEEDGVVLKVVRYRVGIFKGNRAMIAAVYGFPKGGKNLPGLVQVHGGGQFADYKAPLANAKRGYATVSVAWAGRISAPGYTVNSDDVYVFLEGNKQDPKYKVTTDWVGFYGGYHAVDMKKKDIPKWFLDADPESPRNNTWFMWALGVRRGITFLQEQPEVDPEKIGVYGHSMGGKLTVMAAASDSRVKAAAPSCGGQGDVSPDKPIYFATIGDVENSKRISCPIIFLNPSNDFHANIDRVEAASLIMKTKEYRYTRDPHLNHRTQSSFAVCGLLWFDQWLKGNFKMPETPKTEMTLNKGDGIPRIKVFPDTSKLVNAVEIYYSQGERPTDRFWHYARPEKQGDSWAADLKILSADKPLFVYANVSYPLDEPISGASYYYESYTTKMFVVSSHLHSFAPEKLKEAGVKAVDKPSLVIEEFGPDWKKEWYTFNYEDKPPYRSRKFSDAKWQAPKYAALAFDARNSAPVNLKFEADNYETVIPLKGDGQWETVILHSSQFIDKKTGAGFLYWKPFVEIAIGPEKEADKGLPEIKASDIPMPEMRNLRWVELSQDEFNAKRPVRIPKADRRIYLDVSNADEFTHGWKVSMNKSCSGEGLAIGGKKYEKGIGTHANSSALFFLDKRFGKFHAEVGLQGNQPGSVEFSISLDGKKVFESGIMHKDDEAKVVDLDINDATELLLKVTDAGDGIGCDHANWADAWIE